MKKQEVLLLDTFPLVEYIFYCCWEQLPLPRWEFIKKEIKILNSKNIADFRKFLKARQLYTTSEVITELQGHQRKLKFQDEHRQHRQFWSLFLGEFTKNHIREKYIEITDVPVAVIGEFGPTDASLLEIAKKGKMTILLKDRQFAGYCNQHGIKTIDLEIFKIT